MADELPTDFAPAERVSASDLKQEVELFRENLVYTQFSNTLPVIFIILNTQRQIVYANERLLDSLNLEDLSLAYGQRPGELFKCVHASETPGGCGTTRYCENCGAVQAIIGAQEGARTIKECRLTTEGGISEDFRITATPLNLEGQQFTVFTMEDIQHEKRRQALESVFFHDILNTASGVSGLLDVLGIVDCEMERESLMDMTRKASKRLIEEITSSRALGQAERGELEPELKPYSLSGLLEEVVNFYRQNASVEGCFIDLQGPDAPFDVWTDKIILLRCVGNLIKNALEASPENGRVLVRYSQETREVRISVHNKSCIPQYVQDQIFQRSFSTKGKGRGIGTYSIKLFIEKYLKGQVSFESSEISGTTFYISLPRGVPGNSESNS